MLRQVVRLQKGCKKTTEAHSWALVLYFIISDGKIWASSTCKAGALLSQS